MRRFYHTLIAFLTSAACACGTNTDEPVFPIFLALTPIGAPTLLSATPVEIQPVGQPLRYGFDLRYYITNQETGFLGYNLYTSSSATSAEAALGGAIGQAYWPDGIPPTFAHADQAASTTTIITQRVTNFRAPPNTEPFQVCDLYFFRLTAFTRNGFESQASPEISACAAAVPALCPSGTPCNP
jgi:hypothetical protein